jgi:predicted nucleic acid-binding protein
MRWLRASVAKKDAHPFITAVSVAEFLEGAKDRDEAMAILARFVCRNLDFDHAERCAEIQKRAARKGRRFGENDAWQRAAADRAKACIVGRDKLAFSDLGARYVEIRDECL